MSSCCSSAPHQTGKRTLLCPACGQKGSPIPWHILLLHLRAPWQWTDSAEQFGFCANPACDTVYFGETGAHIVLADVRTEIGVKSTSPEATLCYCYGINYGQASDPSLRQFVIEQTRRGQCACEARNPSGRCCLADFPKSGGADSDVQ